MLRNIYIFTFLSVLQVLNADLLPSYDECGLNPNDKLADGIITQIDDFPWTIRLQYEKDDEKSFLCGGVLISKRYILTANFCIDRLDWTLKSVRLGDYNTTSEIDCVKIESEEKCIDRVIDIPVEEVIKNFDNDIALLRMTKDVEFTDYVRPICLPKASKDGTNKYHGKELIVTGFGLFYDHEPLDVKLQFKVIGMNNVECTKIYNKSNTILEKVEETDICADAPSTFCSDSVAGNPLIVLEDKRWTLVGTDSYGAFCNATLPERIPTDYVLTGYYYDWIVANMKP